MSEVILEQRFGKFLNPIPPSNEFLTLNFSLNPISRNNRWRNYGLSADFLGDYFANFFPGEKLDNNTNAINRRNTVKGCVSYIANELLENAITYSDLSSGLITSITLYLYEDKIIFKVINPINRLTAEKYQKFIQNLLQGDIDSLYLEQLEKTAMGGENSNMGLLTMINDYEAEFGWEFTSIASHPSIIQVSVMAHISV